MSLLPLYDCKTGSLIKAPSPNGRVNYYMIGFTGATPFVDTDTLNSCNLIPLINLATGRIIFRNKFFEVELIKEKLNDINGIN